MIFCIKCECGHRFPVCLWKSFLHSNSRELYCPACKKKYIIRKKLPALSLWQKLKRALRSFLVWLRKKTDLKAYLRRRETKKIDRKKIRQLIELCLKDGLVYEE